MFSVGKIISKQLLLKPSLKKFRPIFGHANCNPFWGMKSNIESYVNVFCYFALMDWSSYKVKKSVAFLLNLVSREPANVITGSKFTLLVHLLFNQSTHSTSIHQNTSFQRVWAITHLISDTHRVILEAPLVGFL